MVKWRIERGVVQQTESLVRGFYEVRQRQRRQTLQSHSSAARPFYQASRREYVSLLSCHVCSCSFNSESLICSRMSPKYTCEVISLPCMLEKIAEVSGTLVLAVPF